MSFELIVAAVASYLIGSFSPGLTLAMLRSVDLRNAGSGNTGATNVMRTMGKAAGALTLAVDLLKGVIALTLSVWWADGSTEETTLLISGVAVMIGHIYPVYYGFKGGKGVATAAGIGLYVATVPTLIAFGVFIALVAAKRFVSLASLGAAATLALIGLFSLDGPLKLLFIIICGLITVKHRENITRLLAGTEPKLF